jgi:hypothetical protein
MQKLIKPEDKWMMNEQKKLSHWSKLQSLKRNKSKFNKKFSLNH